MTVHEFYLYYFYGYCVIDTGSILALVMILKWFLLVSRYSFSLFRYKALGPAFLIPDMPRRVPNRRFKNNLINFYNRLITYIKRWKFY